MFALAFALLGFALNLQGKRLVWLMLVGRFIRQLVIASIFVGLVAANPRAGIRPGIWVYSCTAERGLMWEDGNGLSVLGIVFGRVCNGHGFSPHWW